MTRTYTAQWVQRIVDRFSARTKHGGSRWVGDCPVCDVGRNKGKRRLCLTLDTERNVVICTCIRKSCDVDRRLAAVGLAMSDLWQPAVTRGRGSVKDGFVYHDEFHQTLYRLAKRHQGGKFFQVPGPAEGGPWTASHGSITRWVPYNLPMLHAARNGREVIWIMEGESDADRAIRDGHLATCIPRNSWRGVETRWFDGRDLVLVLDHDEPGFDHGRRHVAHLDDIAASITVVRPTDGFKDYREMREHRVDTLVAVDLSVDLPPRPNNEESDGRARGLMTSKNTLITHLFPVPLWRALYERGLVNDFDRAVIDVLSDRARPDLVAKYNATTIAKMLSIGQNRVDRHRVGKSLRRLQEVGLITKTTGGYILPEYEKVDWSTSPDESVDAADLEWCRNLTGPIDALGGKSLDQLTRATRPPMNPYPVVNPESGGPARQSGSASRASLFLPPNQMGQKPNGTGDHQPVSALEVRRHADLHEHINAHGSVVVDDGVRFVHDPTQRCDECDAPCALIDTPTTIDPIVPAVDRSDVAR